MTDQEIQRAQWAKWKRGDRERHYEARKAHQTAYFRRYRARLKLATMKEAA